MISGTTKIKKIKDDDEKKLLAMFNQMIGDGSPDLNIIIPKYEKILDKLHIISSMLEKFYRSSLLDFYKKDNEQDFISIGVFISKIKAKLVELKLEANDHIANDVELAKINADPELLQEFLINSEKYKYKVTDLPNKYKELKNGAVTQEVIVSLRNIASLLQLEKDKSGVDNLADKENLSKNFILNADGDTVELFGFTKLNFKQLFLSIEDLDNDKTENCAQGVEKYILYFLYLFYDNAKAVLSEITTPDIDINVFSELLINNIQKIKTVLPDCGLAFNKIAESATLLKQNFSDYYKDFISSKNPAIIFESFIKDVSMQNKDSDFRLVTQFRKIVQYYTNKSQKLKMDPKTKTIFDLINKNLDILEKLKK